MTRRPRRPMAVAPLVVALAGPGLETLSDGKRSDPDSCQWICPPPAHGGVQDQPGEQDRRQVGAEQHLGRVGDERWAVHRATHAPFHDAEDRHDDERDRRKRDPDVRR
jgi:hypothetical protein